MELKLLKPILPIFPEKKLTLRYQFTGQKRKLLIHGKKQKTVTTLLIQNHWLFLSACYNNTIKIIEYLTRKMSNICRDNNQSVKGNIHSDFEVLGTRFSIIHERLRFEIDQRRLTHNIWPIVIMHHNYAYSVRIRKNKVIYF